MKLSQICSANSRSESEHILKIAKRKRSEDESILCEANLLRFAIFRNPANSHCEFGALMLLIRDAYFGHKNKFPNVSFITF